MTAALDQARAVADAVLYEGYLLYPYRASSSKNQVRWQFGVLGPLGAVEAMVGEEPAMSVDVLLEPGETATIDLQLRFLHAQWRAPEQASAGGGFAPVDELQVGTQSWIAWHEAVEQEITIPGLTVDELLAGHVTDLAVDAAETVELRHDAGGGVAGRLVRTRCALSGRLSVRATPADTTPSALVLRIEVENLAALAALADASRSVRRDLAARQSFLGTHLLATSSDSRFVSLVDPPEWATEVAAQCRNSRWWPVLAGERTDDERRSDILLVAPIILGDFPAIAEQSPGQLFDSAEIDEILTLRIMTMTDAEKAAARATDPQAAGIIDRSDQMAPEVFERLHGVLHDSGPAWFSETAEAAVAPESDVVVVDGVAISRGSRVRLQPRRRADAQDMFLAGQTAVVRRIDLDVDGATHVAVLLDADPAFDVNDWHGRFLYFDPTEVEPSVDVDSGTVSS